MLRVLLVGVDPAEVDFSDPAFPPGMSAETVLAGIKASVALMTDRGWQAARLFVPADPSAAAAVLEAHLAGETYDCISIGGGVRLPPRNAVLFESLVNALHRAAPHAAIAFPGRPQEALEAVDRVIAARSQR